MEVVEAFPAGKQLPEAKIVWRDWQVIVSLNPDRPHELAFSVNRILGERSPAGDAFAHILLAIVGNRVRAQWQPSRDQMVTKELVDDIAAIVGYEIHERWDRLGQLEVIEHLILTTRRPDDGLVAIAGADLGMLTVPRGPSVEEAMAARRRGPKRSKPGRKG